MHGCTLIAWNHQLVHTDQYINEMALTIEFALIEIRKHLKPKRIKSPSDYVCIDSLS